jgi:hypothetical protein
MSLRGRFGVPFDDVAVDVALYVRRHRCVPRGPGQVVGPFDDALVLSGLEHDHLGWRPT